MKQKQPSRLPVLSMVLCLSILLLTGGCESNQSAEPDAEADLVSTAESIEEEALSSQPLYSEELSLPEPDSMGSTVTSIPEHTAPSQTSDTVTSLASMVASDEENPPESSSQPTQPISLPLPDDVALWSGKWTQQSQHGKLLRSPEELTSWLVERYHRSGKPDKDILMYPTKNEVDGFLLSDVVESYRSHFESGNVVLGIYTYYPSLSCHAQITDLTVDGNTLTVRMNTNQDPDKDRFIYLITLAVLPAGCVEGVDQVTIDQPNYLADWYDTKSPYPTRRWLNHLSGDNDYAAILSEEALLDWLQRNSVAPASDGSDMVTYPFSDRDYPPLYDERDRQHPNPDAVTASEDIAGIFTSAFGQGKGVLALRFQHSLPMNNEIVTRIERQGNHLIVYYVLYGTESYGCIAPCNTATIYLMELDAQLLQGVETIEVVCERTYHSMTVL